MLCSVVFGYSIPIKLLEQDLIHLKTKQPAISNFMICLSLHDKTDWVMPTAEYFLVFTVWQQISTRLKFVCQV